MDLLQGLQNTMFCYRDSKVQNGRGSMNKRWKGSAIMPRRLAFNNRGSWLGHVQPTLDNLLKAVVDNVEARSLRHLSVSTYQTSAALATESALPPLALGLYRSSPQSVRGQHVQHNHLRIGCTRLQLLGDPNLKL